MEIVTNINNNNHAKILKELLLKSESVFIAVAFFKKSGLNLIAEELEESLKRGNEIIIVCGLDFFQTEPDALKAIYSLSLKHDNCRLLIQNSNCVFHPKLYYFRSGDKRTILIGSANFTKGGFESNFELSFLSTFNSDIEKENEIQTIIQNIKNNCIDFSEIELSNYTRKYHIYKCNEKNANRDSKAETEALFQLNKSLLKDYLDKYNKDDDEQANYKLRIDNYKKAKEILEIIRNQDLSKSEFFQYYEALVGKAGKKSLWHSGSIFRGKNSVKVYYKQFKTMLEEVINIINKSPNDVLKDVEKYYQSGSVNKIVGLGPNIMTEILNTYAPDKFPVLNQNPLTSIKNLGFEEFPHSQSFSPKNYHDFSILLSGIMKGYGFESLGHVDHFLNYIYWQIKD